MKLIEFIFQNFWHWLGAMAILYVLVNFFANIINRLLRHGILRKHGYPPEHCDADGDARYVDDDEEVNSK